ncbi:uncharacterized protein TNCV_2553401 [Trichonephila clavipes]|nr:uncharacterized protein TNCV_2553401 [Trichonephila clavipes]
MGMTNQHKKWGHKPRLISDNSYSSGHREDDEPDERELIQIPSTAHESVWFMHGDVPSNLWITVRNHILHATYPRRWIGGCGPVAWPPCFLDLNLMDYFFWNHLKSFVYGTLVATVKDLSVQIIVASADTANIPDFFERIRQLFIRQCRLCYHLRALE